MNRICPEKIDSLDKLQAIIFDVDGTLYSLKKMHLFIVLDLFLFFAFRPWRWHELALLYFFRKNREALAQNSSRNVSIVQYEFCVWGKKVDSKYTERVVKKWFYDRPLRYLRICAYADVARWIRALSKRGIKIAYFSDYPPSEKVKTLEFPCDYYIASSDVAVDALKPNPRGLFELASRMNIPIEHCLFVGDTPEKDGVAAKRAGMKFLLLRDGSMK